MSAHLSAPGLDAILVMVAIITAVYRVLTLGQTYSGSCVCTPHGTLPKSPFVHSFIHPHLIHSTGAYGSCILCKWWL